MNEPTKQTCNLYEFLEQTGIHTQLSKIKTERILLEVSARRYATGNFLNSHPNFRKAESELPYRFHRLCIEMISPENKEFSNLLPQPIEIIQIEELARKSFLLIEGACNNLGKRLLELQFQFGTTIENELVVTDVIDNDNSLKDFQFRIPKQTLVFWRGSESDKLPEISNLPGLTVEQPVISAHKKPTYAMEELERLHTVYPEGGVIIALVGMSNGLGPILSARTDWPVISVCTTANEHPEDVWSNLRMPSDVPNLTVLSAKNAVLSAFNILGEKNPAIYAYRRLAIEALDK
ncbi:MAG: AIR carboxylase family protein [Bacteroidales bacterium]|nr:AIR carboxylase family protein [Bacteroidales bacterium]